MQKKDQRNAAIKELSEKLRGQPLAISISAAFAQTLIDLLAQGESK